MGQALAIAAGAGAALKGVGTILGANAQAKQLRSQADQYDVAAGQERASSQRSAMEQQRQARLASSRALALAAASGGGASDPTVINNIADIAGEGEYRALTALYNGDQQGRAYEAQASGLRKEAKNVKKAGLIGGVGSILSTGASLYDKYGSRK